MTAFATHILAFVMLRLIYRCVCTQVVKNIFFLAPVYVAPAEIIGCMSYNNFDYYAKHAPSSNLLNLFHHPVNSAVTNVNASHKSAQNGLFSAD